ncbi:thermonuclease family protein [Agrobacterium rhizogenes]|nr:thermonuclease family protein [Rhizobium rhizogenes]
MTIRSLVFASVAVATITIFPHPRLAQSAQTQFTICEEGVRRTDCVVDGDTFWMDGVKIRIADIDAPETHPARCAQEQELGEAATFRLQDMLNSGPFELAPIDRDEDQYGRKLRIVLRGNQSVGAELVNEGVARRWEGKRRPWCSVE